MFTSYRNIIFPLGLCLWIIAWRVAAQEVKDYTFGCTNSGVISVSPNDGAWRYSVGKGSAEDLIISTGGGVQFGKKGNDCDYAELVRDAMIGVTQVIVTAYRTTNSTATLQVSVGGVPLGEPQQLSTRTTSHLFLATQPLDGELVVRFEQNLEGASQKVSHAFSLLSASITLAGTPCAVIGSTGYATIYQTSAFIMPQGLCGGIIKETKEQQGTLQIDWLYPSGVEVPGHTPLLLQGAAGMYPLSVLSETQASRPVGNLLGGSSVNALTASESGKECYYYRLTHKEDDTSAAVFAWGETEGAAFLNKAGCAYLALPKLRFAPASLIPISSISTEIANAKIADEAYGTVEAYAIDGRRIGCRKPGSGIFIINKQKIFVK